MFNKRYLRNTIWGIFSLLIPLALYLLSVPIIYQYLGKDMFGIYLLITSVVSLYIFFDFGLSNALIKFLSEAIVKNDTEQASLFYSNSTLLFCLIASVLSAVLYLNSSAIVVNLFSVPPALHEECTIILKLVSFNFFLNLILSLNSSIAKAFFRYDFFSIVRIVGSVFLSIGSIVLVKLGYGLLSIVILNIVLTVLSLLIMHFFNKRLMKSKSIIFKINLDTSIIVLLFTFGLYSFLANIASFLFFQTDKFFISHYMGPAFVPLFVIPITVIYRVHSIANAGMESLFPEATTMFANLQIQKLKHSYIQFQKFLLPLSLAFAILLIAFGELILKFLMKEQFNLESLKIYYLLTLNLPALFLTVPIFHIVNAAGNPKLNLIFSSITGILFAAGCLFLIPYFGLWGVVMANLVCIPIIIFTIYYLQKKILSITSKEIFFKVLLPVLPLVITYLLFLFVVYTNKIYSLISIMLLVLNIVSFAFIFYKKITFRQLLFKVNNLK